MTAAGVLYVVSSGRSGSTLLELLLATHPDVRTLGELQALPHALQSPMARCGCGALMTECPLWTAVRDDGVLDRLQEPLELVREELGAGRVLRWGWLREILRPVRGRMAGQHADGSAAATRSLLDAIERIEAEPPSWWVDSSKDPYRLHLLAAGGLSPLRGVLLVRDPRAFVHATAGSSLPRTIRMALRWDAQQLLAGRALRWLEPDDQVVLRYEDLAAAPDTALDHTAGIMHLDPSGFDVASFRSVAHHAVAGNAMRFADEPPGLDERWRLAAPRWQQAFVWALCAPVARRFGYSRSVP